LRGRAALRARHPQQDRDILGFRVHQAIREEDCEKGELGSGTRIR
jgi:hypothetical protein